MNWALDLYDDENNQPYGAIFLPDEDAFIILGQRFLEQDSM